MRPGDVLLPSSAERDHRPELVLSWVGTPAMPGRAATISAPWWSKHGEGSKSATARCHLVRVVGLEHTVPPIAPPRCHHVQDPTCPTVDEEPSLLAGGCSARAHPRLRIDRGSREPVPAAGLADVR